MITSQQLTDADALIAQRTKPSVVHGVYGHKTKQDRQREAMEAKRKYLGRPEQNLRDAVEYVDKGHGSLSSFRLIELNQKHLVEEYVRAGYTRHEAQGMARSVRAGGERSAWLSGKDV